MVLPACHAGARRTAEASRDGRKVGGLGIETCRVPAGRTGNTADTWDSTRLWMDLLLEPYLLRSRGCGVVAAGERTAVAPDNPDSGSNALTKD